MRRTGSRPIIAGLFLSMFVLAPSGRSAPPTDYAVGKWRSEGTLQNKLANFSNHCTPDSARQPGNLPLTSRIATIKRVSAQSVVDTVTLLALLVEFPDYRMADGYVSATAHDFDSILFSSAGSGGPVNPTGSMSDYFREISYGRLLIRGEVRGPYLAEHTYAWYLGNDDGLTMSGQLAAEVARKADPDIDYRDFATESNRLHGLIIIHAGPGAEDGAVGIWSHHAATPGDTHFDSVDIASYLMAPEELITYSDTNGSGEGEMSAIGLFCHEYARVLGLPPLYDITRQTGSSGLGSWCLMSHGFRNGRSRRPAHPSAWCRMQLGWLAPSEVLAQAPQASLPPVELEPVAYRIWSNVNDASPVEYWLVENRQPFGFDDSLPGHGLLIYHVDVTRAGNIDPNAYMVALEQADGLNSLAWHGSLGDPGDPFPGSSFNREFFCCRFPNSQTNDGDTTGVAVWNISESDSLMTADLDAVPIRPFVLFADRDSLEFIEAVGDGDGVLEGGETIEFNCRVQNVVRPAYEARLSLHCDDSGIDIVENGKPLSQWLSPGETVDLTEPIIFSIPTGFVTHRVHFQLDIAIDTSLTSPTAPVHQTLEFDTILAQTPTSVDDTAVSAVPDHFGLAQNFPNPFNPTTTITYRVGLSETGVPPGRVRLAVYNSLGQRVRLLVDEVQPPGSYQVAWNGRDDSGRFMATGVYYFRLEHAGQTASKKMLLLK